MARKSSIAVDNHDLDRFVEAQAVNYDDAVAELRNGRKVSHCLRECFTVLLNTTGRSAHEIFGLPDDLKLRSSATLFAHASNDSVFGQILDKYFDGKPDDKTLQLLGAS